MQYTTSNGFFRSVSVRPCEECRGTGKKIIEPCSTCKGKGYVKTNTKIAFDIPAGADNGSYLRKPGYGEASTSGGAPGDLIVVIKVEPSKVMKRKNFDLYVTVPISFTTAVMGGRVKVPVIDELLELSIPEGTQSGKMFYVRGKGIKTQRGTGDLYVEVIVEIPVKLSKSQRKVLEEFEKESEPKQTPMIREFNDNLDKLYGKGK